MSDAASEASPTLRTRRAGSLVDQAVITAARELLLEGGYTRLTMHGVAARAGASTASLYRRFADRDELVMAALLEHGRPLPLPDTGSLTGDLGGFAHQAADFLTGPGGRLLQAVLGEVPHNEQLAQLLRRRAIEPGQDDVRAMLDRAVRRGEIAAGADPVMVRDLVIGPLLHRVTVTAASIDGAVVDELVRLVLRGLGAEVPGGDGTPVPRSDISSCI